MNFAKVAPEEEVNQDATRHSSHRLSHRVSAGGRDIEGTDALGKAQIELKTSTAAQQRVVKTLQLCIICDMAGAFFCQPVYAKMCGRAEGYSGEVEDEAFNDPGIKYSIAISLFAAFNSAGMALSNVIFPTVSDKIGRKPIIVLFQAASIIGHLVAFISNTSSKEYWIFCACQFWMGLFGGSVIICLTYLADMFPDPRDAELKTACTYQLMSAASIAVSVGSLFGLGIHYVTSKKLFYGSLLGAVFSSCGFLASWTLPGQMKTLQEIKAAMKKSGVEVPTPKTAKNTIYMIMIAMTFDTIGSCGLNTIRQNGPVLYGTDYMDLSDIITATQVFAVLAGIPLCVLISTKAPGKGPVHACVLGNVMTGFWQLMHLGSVDTTNAKQITIQMNGPSPMPRFQPSQTYSMEFFIVLIYAGQITNIFSTLTNDTLVQAVAPPDKRGFWGGRARLCQNICNAAGPVVWACLTMDGIEDFTRMLTICSTISFLAALCYLPQYRYYPMPAKEEGMRLEDVLPLIDIEEDAWNKVAYLQREEINFLRVEKGKRPYKRQWDSYQDDMKSTESGHVPYWADNKQVGKVFKFFKNKIIGILSDREKMSQMAKAVSAEMANRRALSNVGEAKEAMGRWIADYFDAAGYERWYSDPDLFKVMIANSFPSIAGVEESESDNFSEADIEVRFLGALRVADMHTHMHRRQNMLSKSEELQNMLSNGFARA